MPVPSNVPVLQQMRPIALLVGFCVKNQSVEIIGTTADAESDPNPRLQ